MPDRTLVELAVAAVDASQSEGRELHVTPREYGLLVDQVQLDDTGAIVDQWDPLVLELARRQRLTLPLPAVKVVVNTRPTEEDLMEEGWLALEEHAREQGWDEQ